MSSRAATMKSCLHCGNEFAPAAHRADYCCAGCQFVHSMIRSQGLGQFYELQSGMVPPVKSTVFRPRDYQWLSDLVAQAEQNGETSLRLEVQGLSCLGCVWLIERIFERAPGALSARVALSAGELVLRWSAGRCDLAAFAAELQSFGYLLGPLGKDGARKNAAANTLLLRLGVCGALAMNAMLFTMPRYLGLDAGSALSAFFDRVAVLLSSASLLIGGSYFFARSWSALRRGAVHIDLPISMGLLVAYFGSLLAWARDVQSFAYFDFISIFTFLMLVGRWLQIRVIDRNRRQLLSTQHAPPHVLTPDGARVSADTLQRGMRFLVEPGCVVPVRALLESEEASIGLDWINGESDSQQARKGRYLPSGASNLSRHSITLVAAEPWTQSMLERLLQIPPTEPERNPHVERFIRAYILCVVVLGIAGASAWWWQIGDALAAMQVFISVLVVSCPCATGVALPLLDDCAAGGLRQHGVFIRESSLWARLLRVKKIVFDKTGTLSFETLSLQNPEAVTSLEHQARSVLLAMTTGSPHPVSACLREELLAIGAEPTPHLSMREHAGLGIEATFAASHWRLGRAAWTGAGAGDCVFVRDGVVQAEFFFGEAARADAEDEIARLQASGRSVYILSGDRPEKVAAMAKRLGVARERCLSEITPTGKADWLRLLDACDTLYIGDGANDSLAFDAAWCCGTPAADRGLLEHKAGFYYLGRGLSGVRELLDAARRRRNIQRAVFLFAITYNLAAIALSLAGKMNPLLAAILMPASSLACVGMVLFSRRRISNCALRGERNGASHKK